MLKFNIRNQRLTRIDSFHPVEKSVKYLYAEFNFLTPEWEGVRKKLVSESDGTYEADIVEGKCLIPWEVLNGGEFKLCVRGIDGEKVIPTNYVTVDLGKTLNDGWPGNEPTPSPEERLQKQIGDLEKLNTENKENLVAAINEVASKPGGGGGKDGLSAYEIAVKNGFEGTEQEWLESLKGKDGHTPEKGVDYFTEADKAELVEDVIAALPKWDGGSY